MFGMDLRRLQAYCLKPIEAKSPGLVFIVKRFLYELCVKYLISNSIALASRTVG